jgi:hypothetical protein
MQGSNRQRFTAMYTWRQKIPTGIILLIMVWLLIGGIFDRTGSFIPEKGHWATIALLAICVIVFGRPFFARETILEYDDDNLYILNPRDNSERSIPLEKLTRLNMRPTGSRIGAYWFQSYSLHFLDEAGQEEKIRCNLRIYTSSVDQFESFVKSKNPDFTFKNWTHSFDWSD